MGTTADKLNKLLETKAAIKNAIIAKGVEVADSDTFASYPAKIDSIEVGGGSDDFLAIRTNNGTDMSHLFYNYQGTNLDISSWNTDNVTDMEYMFYNCCNLKSLDLSNFNTNNVTNMESMFVGCTNLERLDLSNFIINSSLYSMLVGCDKLQELRLDNCNNDTISKIINSYGFPTGEVDGDIRKMYVNPDNIDDLEAPNGWIFVDSDGNEIVQEPEIPLYEVGMFSDAENKAEITEVNVLVTSEHDNLFEMFNGLENLEIIHNMDKWDTSNVWNMEGMFKDCKKLEVIDLRNFNIDNHPGVTDMFSGCEKLYILRLDSFDREQIEKIINDSNLPTGNIELNDGRTQLRQMYVREDEACDFITPDGWQFIYVGKEPDEKYESGAFYNNTTITTANVAVTEDNDSLSEMFYNCRNLQAIHNIDTWRTSNVTNMKKMFQGCNKLTYLDLSGFDTYNVTDMGSMFQNCSILDYLDIRNFDMGSVENTSGMFAGCTVCELRLDNCNYKTISAIITSNGFPTDTLQVNGETLPRRIYVQEANTLNEWGEDRLNAPDGWEFVYLVEPKKEEE